ncbi:MAG: hypothetical protein K8R58_01695 [Bacteroidales bacterium]|nr:hypothetical protein [Bacteroidales bacterium]
MYQKLRGEILLWEYQDIEKVYKLSMMFRNVLGGIKGVLFLFSGSQKYLNKLNLTSHSFSIELKLCNFKPN